ncbi:MAG: DUF5691 domain-containing protein [Deinococcales bacterium]
MIENDWQSLLSQALLGGEADLASKFEGLGQDKELLSAAARLSLYLEAAQTLPTTEVMLKPCPVEQKNLLNPQASSYFYSLQTEPRLLTEWLDEVVKSGKILRPETVASVLNFAERQVSLRPQILKIMGERGRWLAVQNPLWEFAVKPQDPLEAFELGSLTERVAALSVLRQENPDKACELLESTWPQESYETKLALLNTFEQGLSLKDETFLEKVLPEKRKDLRMKAAELLALMPESALVKRLSARAKGLLNYKAGKGRKKGNFEISLPEWDKGLEQDGIDPKNKPYNLGEKAWYLKQILERIPPSFWSDDTSEAFLASPETLLQSARKDKEWGALLLEVWSQAAIRFRDETWALALLQSFVRSEMTLDAPDLKALLRSFPNAESFITEVLESQKQLSKEVEELILNSPKLSYDFSARLLEKLGGWERGSSYFLHQLAHLLHPQSLTALSPHLSNVDQHYDKGYQRALDILKLRQELHQAIQLEPQLDTHL